VDNGAVVPRSVVNSGVRFNDRVSHIRFVIKFQIDTESRYGTHCTCTGTDRYYFWEHLHNELGKSDSICSTKIADPCFLSFFYNAGIQSDRHPVLIAVSPRQLASYVTEVLTTMQYYFYPPAICFVDSAVLILHSVAKSQRSFNTATAVLDWGDDNVAVSAISKVIEFSSRGLSFFFEFVSVNVVIIDC
jgi:hypothetical protein